jgi:hypothetical protein
MTGRNLPQGVHRSRTRRSVPRTLLVGMAVAPLPNDHYVSPDEYAFRPACLTGDPGMSGLRLTDSDA